ncbi:hypothetical protein FRC07_009704 [Ceratobasidium sp. 392]|nr:hypothetical protein FRC07_009704 [Ceratobasidium sp. 392]
MCSIPVPSTLYDPEGVDDVKATNVVALGSYNWAEHSAPTIVIPGSPSVWKEPTLPLRLNPDSGPTFIDQNAARSRKSPLEPMLRAISVIRGAPEGLSLSNENIDIVTDRNNLRKLMRFICANGPNRDPRKNRTREFRIDAQLAPNGKTLILTRHENNNVDHSTHFKGYGHNFEVAVTTKPPAPLVAVKGRTSTAVSRTLKATGYHRIIRYDLLGLRFMVRFEVDAMTNQDLCLPDELQNEADVLAGMLAHTSLYDYRSVAPNTSTRVLYDPVEPVRIEGSELRHILHGELAPQSSLIELKTLSSKFGVTWSDVYPQLFLSQTPMVKVVKHWNGVVNAIQTYTDASESMQKAHSDLSQDFRTLVVLLTQMRAVAVRYRGTNKPLSFYWTGSGDMRARIVERSDHLLSTKDLAMF